MPLRLASCTRVVVRYKCFTYDCEQGGPEFSPYLSSKLILSAFFQCNWKWTTKHGWPVQNENIVIRCIDKKLFSIRCSEQNKHCPRIIWAWLWSSLHAADEVNAYARQSFGSLRNQETYWGSELASTSSHQRDAFHRDSICKALIQWSDHLYYQHFSKGLYFVIKQASSACCNEGLCMLY